MQTRYSSRFFSKKNFFKNTAHIALSPYSVLFRLHKLILIYFYFPVITFMITNYAYFWWISVIKVHVHWYYNVFQVYIFNRFNKQQALYCARVYNQYKKPCNVIKQCVFLGSVIDMQIIIYINEIEQPIDE